MTELGPPVAIGNIDIILAMFPTSRQEDECMFILGNYIELVAREVIAKRKELLLNTMLGVLLAKIESVRTKAVPQVPITV